MFSCSSTIDCAHCARVLELATYRCRLNIHQEQIFQQNYRRTDLVAWNCCICFFSKIFYKVTRRVLLEAVRF
uniref:Bridge-like lipid transfer protein family member 1 C-terminal domain-containing protein n=1 Tax=Parascaris univalens TaxID=6257 RepID=A0A914ZX18_PARUN